MDTTLKPYKPNHPNAPRRVRQPLGNVKLSAHARAQLLFDKKNPDIKLADREKGKILKAFNENLAKECVDNRNGVVLPERMGKLEIITYKASRKRLKVDRYNSKKIGLEVHINPVLRGDGRKTFVDFDVKSDSYNMMNKMLWAFIPSTKFKREKNAAFEKNRGKYKGDTKSRAAYYRKDNFYRKLAAKAIDAELLKTYNEFDFS